MEYKIIYQAPRRTPNQYGPERTIPCSSREYSLPKVITPYATDLLNRVNSELENVRLEDGGNHEPGYQCKPRRIP